MKRFVIVLTILVAGCGTSKSAGFEPPASAIEVETGVWAKDAMLYGTDCAHLAALTKEGAKYGPSPRQADGSYTPGFGTACYKP